MQLLQLPQRRMQATSKHLNRNLPVLYAQLHDAVLALAPPRNLVSFNENKHAVNTAKVLFLPRQRA